MDSTILLLLGRGNPDTYADLIAFALIYRDEIGME